VHINSGIPNRAFCIAAKAMGGYAWETVGPVWYRTLTERLHQQSTFLECAEATVSVASEIAGPGSELTDAVREGWRTVKVLRAGGAQQKGRTGSGTRRVVATTGNGAAAASRKPRRPARRRPQHAGR
jgi:hypothetical protein